MSLFLHSRNRSKWGDTANSMFRNHQTEWRHFSWSRFGQGWELPVQKEEAVGDQWTRCVCMTERRQAPRDAPERRARIRLLRVLADRLQRKHVAVTTDYKLGESTDFTCHCPMSSGTPTSIYTQHQHGMTRGQWHHHKGTPKKKEHTWEKQANSVSRA